MFIHVLQIISLSVNLHDVRGSKRNDNVMIIAYDCMEHHLIKFD